MRISDWSSDVCSSDLPPRGGDGPATMSGHQRPCSAELTPRPHLAMRVIQKLVQIRPAVAVRIAPAIVTRRVQPVRDFPGVRHAVANPVPIWRARGNGGKRPDGGLVDDRTGPPPHLAHDLLVKSVTGECAGACQRSEE